VAAPPRCLSSVTRAPMLSVRWRGSRLSVEGLYTCPGCLRPFMMAFSSRVYRPGRFVTLPVLIAREYE